MKRKIKIAILLAATAICSFAMAFVAFGVFETFYPDKITFRRNEVSADNIKKFNEVRSILNKNYYQPLDQDMLLEGAVAGMVDSIGDKYTSYLSKEEWKTLKEDLQGVFKGIGVLVRTAATGSTVIEEVYPDSPAQKAGFLAGDIFQKIDGKDVSKSSNVEVVKLIKESKKEDVNIEVLRPSTGELLKKTLTKRKIQEINTESKMLEDNVAYIRIKSFDENVHKQFMNEVNKLMKMNAKGIVIDVRDNPGGDLNKVVDICDMLLPKALIVYIEDRGGNKKVFESDNYSLSIPVTVLINGRSASASEILASALRDNNRATLIGTKTFGKGLVQTAHQLFDGSCIYYTSARYFTPKGVSIHGTGVEPDVKVELPEKFFNTPVSAVPFSEDAQLQKAIEELKKKM